MTPKTLLIVAAAAGLLAIAPLPLAAENPQGRDVGFVLDLHGEWELADSSPVLLRIGRAVPADGTIRPRQAQPASFITIVLFDGSTTLSRSCRIAGDCAKPLVLPSRTDTDTFWARALKTMGGLLSRQDESLVPVMSRAVFTADEEVQAHEAVVELANGSVDLAPVIEGSAAGRYTVILETAARGNATPAAPLTAVFDWSPGQPVKASGAKLIPGLYAVTVLPDRDEVYAPTGASAWILVSSAETFEKRARAFAEATALTRHWEKPVRKQAVRRFLRACLEMLADESGGSGGSGAQA